MALFAADFTRFARKERDIAPVAATGSLFAIITYVCGALVVYYGFDKSVAYFSAQGMDPLLAANAAVTNPGVSLVLAAGGVGLAIICLSQMKVETSNSIGGANAVSNLVHSLFGRKLPWAAAVVGANAIGLAFILGNILDQVNAFMSYGSILTSRGASCSSPITTLCAARWASARWASIWRLPRRRCTGAAWAPSRS